MVVQTVTDYDINGFFDRFSILVDMCVRLRYNCWSVVRLLWEASISSQRAVLMSSSAETLRKITASKHGLLTAKNVS